MSGLEDGHDQGFLTRWSRRKRQIEQEQEQAQQQALAAQHSGQPMVPAPGIVAADEPDSRLRDPETGEIIDEDLVRSLPGLADLQPGGDLSAFMRKGVPESMRREALRTMWSADPAIRDFVSPALDYAYDYNAPGGAPGFGPLSASDLVQAKEFLKTIFSDPPLEPTESGPELASQVPSHDSDIVSHDLKLMAHSPSSTVRLTDAALQDLPENDAAAHLPVASVEDTSDTEKPRKTELAMVQSRGHEIGADPENQENTRPEPSFRRRGGGASPV